MKYGKELAERIKKEIKNIEEIQKDRNERISSFKTDEEDCFLSTRIDEQELAKLKKQLAILNTDGCMDWEAIVDENGNEVNVHWFKNKWGGAIQSSARASLQAVNKRYLRRLDGRKKLYASLYGLTSFAETEAESVPLTLEATRMFAGIRIWLRANMWAIPTKKQSRPTAGGYSCGKEKTNGQQTQRLI